jgi:hypothetical protein
LFSQIKKFIKHMKKRGKNLIDKERRMSIAIITHCCWHAFLRVVLKSLNIARNCTFAQEWWSIISQAKPQQRYYHFSKTGSIMGFLKKGTKIVLIKFLEPVSKFLHKNQKLPNTGKNHIKDIQNSWPFLTLCKHMPTQSSSQFHQTC